MTNDRAIELLKRISDSQFDGPHGDTRREALSMAVRALEQNLVKESGGLVQDLVKDCISRKMAIDAFEPEHDTDWYTPRIIEVLEALPPVQPTQTNADSTQSNTLDCVSRRAAMIVIENSGLDDDSKDTVVRVLEQLPSAQPETHDKRTETHACDLINRQQAIDAVKDLPNCCNGFSDTYDKACIIGVLEDLPTAQPQRKKGKWIYHSNWEADGECGYECSECGMGSDVDYGYCMRCGARMDGESE